MNALFQASRQLAVVTLPAELENLAPPLLLPGENLEQYHLLRQAIIADISPKSAIEWLLVIDVVELSWEIRRYRLLRHKLLEAYRQKAIEATLRSIDVVGIAPEMEDLAEHYTLLNALSWKSDRIAATEIEARLASHGFDDHAINVEVYVQAREVFILFESLANSAQARRLLVLKEINKHRITRAEKRD